MSVQVPAAILAGGQSRRLGRPKSMIQLGGQTLIERVAGRLESQTGKLAVSVADGATADLLGDVPMLPDVLGPGFGPLAGIHAALLWARDQAEEPGWVLTVPVDAPFIPLDLAEGLMTTAEKAGAAGAFAATKTRTHPLHALWHTSLTERLQHAIEAGVRSVHAWAESQSLPQKLWQSGEFDPFFNINTEADLLLAERAIQAGHVN